MPIPFSFGNTNANNEIAVYEKQYVNNGVSYRKYNWIVFASLGLASFIVWLAYMIISFILFKEIMLNELPNILSQTYPTMYTTEINITNNKPTKYIIITINDINFINNSSNTSIPFPLYQNHIFFIN